LIEKKIFTYIEGGYEKFSIGFWEGMEICTWNFIYPPPSSSNYFMTGPYYKMTEKRQISLGYIIRILQHFATKLWNIINFVMLFQAVMKFLSRSKF
jgi:hypothetical protein